MFKGFRETDSLPVLDHPTDPRMLHDLWQMQGGDGVGWRDILWDKNGARSRLDTTVNVDQNNVIGYITDGEWLAYSVTSNGGLFKVTYSLAGAPPAPVNLKVFLTLGADCTTGAQQALHSTPSFTTKDYSKFETFAATSNLSLPAGASTIKLCWATASYVQFQSFTLAAINPTPFGSVAASLPGTVNAPRFDEGGEGVAYHEESKPGLPVVRSTAAVTGDQLALGYLQPGEWVRYTVTVKQAGQYLIEYLLAGAPQSPQPISLSMALNGNCVTSPKLAPYSNSQFGTGSWVNPVPFAAGQSFLPAGQHVLTLCMGDQVGSLNIMGMRFTAVTSAPTPGAYVSVLDVVHVCLCSPCVIARVLECISAGDQLCASCVCVCDVLQHQRACQQQHQQQVRLSVATTSCLCR